MQRASECGEMREAQVKPEWVLAIVLIPLLIAGEIVNDITTIYYRLSDWRRRHVVADKKAERMGVLDS